MTGRQRESAAKYAYDLSKIVFTVAVITNLFGSAPLTPVNFWLGILTASALYLVGYLFDGMED